MFLETVFKLITGALFAFHLIRVYGLPMRIRRAFSMPNDRRIKPFDCEYCLCGWMALLFYFIPINIVLPMFCLLGGAYLSKYLK